MTRRPHLARNLALALIFALGLALIDPVAAGIAFFAVLGLGLWGVPSFRVGDTAVWGQDRLWAVQQALLQAPGSSNLGAVT